MQEFNGLMSAIVVTATVGMGNYQRVSVGCPVLVMKARNVAMSTGIAS